MQVRLKSSAMQRHRRIIIFFFFFFLLQRRINYFILPFCFSFSFFFFFFFSRNTNYAYYLDEVVGFKILKETNCPLRRVWKYQVFSLFFFFFLATLENRPLLEPLICLILSKKSFVKLLKNFSRSLSLSLSRARAHCCFYFNKS